MRRILDLFCGGGGAAMGYHRAGFEVVGVDHERQPNYPFEYYVEDVLSMAWSSFEGFDAIHASPPCQFYAPITKASGNQNAHPDLVDTVRQTLVEIGLPYVIENVPEAPIRQDFLLCGSMFGLKVRRHRAFEINWYKRIPEMRCNHDGLLVFTHARESEYAAAMGVPWMSTRDSREAIPPAYTEYIGTHLLKVLP